MAKFGYARINASSGHGILVETTDQELLRKLRDVVTKAYPKCQISDGIFFRDRVNKPFYALQFSKLNDEDLPAAWWLLAILCQEGWEPFYRADNYVSDSSMISTPRLLTIDLKLKIE